MCLVQPSLTASTYNGGTSCEQTESQGKIQGESLTSLLSQVKAMPRMTSCSKAEVKDLESTSGHRQGVVE